MSRPCKSCGGPIEAHLPQDETMCNACDVRAEAEQLSWEAMMTDRLNDLRAGAL